MILIQLQFFLNNVDKGLFSIVENFSKHARS